VRRLGSGRAFRFSGSDEAQITCRALPFNFFGAQQLGSDDPVGPAFIWFETDSNQHGSLFPDRNPLYHFEMAAMSRRLADIGWGSDNRCHVRHAHGVVCRVILRDVSVRRSA